MSLGQTQRNGHRQIYFLLFSALYFCVPFQRCLIKHHGNELVSQRKTTNQIKIYNQFTTFILLCHSGKPIGTNKNKLLYASEQFSFHFCSRLALVEYCTVGKKTEIMIMMMISN